MAANNPRNAVEPFFTQVGPDGREVTTQIPGRAGWIVTLVLEPETPWIREVRVRPDGSLPAGGITHRLLRDLPLSAGRPTAGSRSLCRYEPPERSPGRGWAPADYAALAARYLALVADGSRQPNADLAAELGPGYSNAWVKEAIRRARQHGYLTKPDAQGQVGGELTDLALQALAD